MLYHPAPVGFMIPIMMAVLYAKHISHICDHIATISVLLGL